MILDIVLSIVLTFAAGGPTGNFHECPAAGETETVATSQYTPSSSDVQQA